MDVTGKVRIERASRALMLESGAIDNASKHAKMGVVLVLNLVSLIEKLSTSNKVGCLVNQSGKPYHR